MLKRKLLKRFISDTKIPVSPVDRLDYWERVFQLFPGSREKLETFVEEVEGNPDKWMDDFEALKNKIISDFKGSDAYKNFITSDMKAYELLDMPEGGISGKSVYEIVKDTDTTGKVYLSLDLKAANFQVLRFLGVYSDPSWHDLISRYTESEHIRGSKYFRSVIYGNLNVGRVQTVEKYLTNEVRRYLETAEILPENYKLISMMSDELVYEVSEGELAPFSIRELEAAVKEEVGVDVKISHFVLKHQYLQSASNPGRKIKFFSRHEENAGEGELVCVGAPYAMIAQALWKTGKVEELDKLFLNQESFLCMIQDELEIKEGL